MTWQLDTDFIEPTIGEFRYEIKTIWIMQTIGTAWMAGLCHYEDEPPPDEVLLEGRRRSQILLASAIRTISPAQRQQFNFLDPKFRPMCAEEGCGKALEILYMGYAQPLYQVSGLHVNFVTKCPEDEHGGIDFNFEFPENWEGNPGFHVNINLLSASMFEDCDDPTHDHD